MNFVRVVAPDDVLKRYAEILNLRLPMKKVRGRGIGDNNFSVGCNSAIK